MSINDTLKRLEENKDLSKDISFLKIKKYILDSQTAVQEEKKEEDFVCAWPKTFDEKLAIAMETIRDIAIQVEEWEVDTMKGYVALKKIEKTLKKFIKPVWEYARQNFENYDKNNLPYGATWTLQLKTTIDYKTNEVYLKANTKLKDLEGILKNAVEQDKKGNVVCDKKWNVIEVPEFKMSETLVIKWI